MSSKLSNLRKEGKISQYDYDTYLLFVGNDVGSIYLKKMLESILMEEPVKPTKQLFAWHDGRRSVWRDIKLSIDRTEKLLKGTINDRNNDGY